MKKKILSFLMVFLLLISCYSCKSNVGNENNVDPFAPVSEELQIFNTGLKLSQEQVLSRIKADNLLKNNGYVSDDEITIVIKMKSGGLIDLYNEKYSDEIKSVAEFSKTNEGKAKLEKIQNEQLDLIRTLVKKELINSIEHRYSTVLNAVAVTTTYGQLKSIEKIKNVESAIISDTFNLPKTTKSSEISKVENIVEVDPNTGIFDPNIAFKGTEFEGQLTGNGTSVAILDSGFDCSHTVFKNVPEKEDLTYADIASILPNMNSSKTTKSLEMSDVYFSKKIPYAYDYADKDSDVFPYDSEHGTHVAGIIGGKDDVITGVAVNTQLILMKVFPDLDAGADTDDILAALEDAVLLGVDAINMSLGSSCGFSREVDKVHTNEVYDSIKEAGISLLTAASNSYSSSFSGAQGDTNFVTNPDSATVGSPSTYDACLSVASISGVKSKYITTDDGHIFFFTESNKITGDPNDFFENIGLKPGETKEFEYVTVPGVGLPVNFQALGNIDGKIALIKRGSNTFEEKAINAYKYGAAGCIIYNNIEGDIRMSMGKLDPEQMPTISISKEDGTKLAAKKSGKLILSYENQSGPFMSDFSSWGPTPDLGIKPEIAAHGGDIYSSVPGGGYEHQSGTSMATPNLCGMVVLVRQFLKETYPTATAQEILKLTNQLLMSTANIVKNEYGNPYSPRKQGAGLASLSNVVNTKAYLTVDGSDRSKLELLDDPKRQGVYEMNFNVVNLTNETLVYGVDLDQLTESVSSSDEKHVAEKSHLLDGKFSFEVHSGGKVVNSKISVNPGETAKVTLTYTLSSKDKAYIDELFPYGMFVEGFVKLIPSTEGEVQLNMPFLAFYGDWTEAPMFDRTYYEVETEAHDGGIDEEDKLKADYLATTPYGSYFNNYMIPLGTYIYDIDESKYDPIPASLDRISVSDTLGTLDGILCVYAGLLRGAKQMDFSITDKITGDVIWSLTDYNASKSYSNGAMPLPYYKELKLKSHELGLINNREYEFKMEGKLDYKNDGTTTNRRNTFNFDFQFDNEAPILKDCQYEKVYDKNLKKDRYYMTMTVYDNHYVQSISPIIFTSNSSYTFLSDGPIPVYSEKGQDNKVKIEITDYLKDIKNDVLLPNAIAFSIDDYALNSNIYLCQLPGTKGDFKFTKDGTPEGTDMLIHSMYEGELVDLTNFLSTKDKTVDSNKDYLKYLMWESSNEKVAVVKEGIVKAVKAGKTTITVRENLDGKQAVLILNVKEKEKPKMAKMSAISSNEKLPDNVEDSKIKDIRFSYFDTVFAYKRAAQTSDIGQTGDRRFLNALSEINIYPGEKIKLHYDFEPWYAEENYKVHFKSMNENLVKVDPDGVVTGLKKGRTSVVLTVDGSRIQTKVTINVKSEFVIENRTLIAYKGLGGDVVIPDDEGILYIGSFAFCLYDVDNNIIVDEDDYDANKKPGSNPSITSVTIPHGVEDVQKYAFYNCPNLKSVTLPDTIKYVREYAFTDNVKLENINLNDVKVIGEKAFAGCENLANITMNKIYAIGVQAFMDCTSLTQVDLSTLRNSGKEAFKGCTALKDVTLSEHTKLSYAMFVKSGIESIDIYEMVEIPDFCFALCNELKTVNIHNSLYSIGRGAFSECSKLTTFNIMGEVELIKDQAFYKSTGLTKFSMPNSTVSFGNYVFYQCSNLNEIEFKENTYLKNINGSIFADTNINKFTVDPNNANYIVSGNYLVNKENTVIIFAATGINYGDLVITDNYLVVGPSAFAGANVTSLDIKNVNTEISDYAFSRCSNLVTITFPVNGSNKIGKYAFEHTSKLNAINNFESVKNVDNYAFTSSNIPSVTLGANNVYGEGVFFKSKVKTVTIGENVKIGFGGFQECLNLTTVNMPALGGVTFGSGCFAKDILLKNIDLSKVDGRIEDETFYGCKALVNANLENITYIGKYAFSDCAGLYNVTMPMVVEIAEGAFSRHDQYATTAKFSTIELPNSLKIIADGAFLGCEGLTSIVIPNSLKSMGSFVFSFCKNLQSVTLPESINYIGKYSFAGCESLTKINLENVEIIDEYAFAKCYSLENIDLTNIIKLGEAAFGQTSVTGSFVLPKLVEIGNFAFQNANVRQVNAQSLKTIGMGAFQNNFFLNEFVLSNELSEIKPQAFVGCRSLVQFTFGEDKKNDGKINDYAYLIDGILYTVMPSGHSQLTNIPAGKMIETLIVPEGTFRVEQYAANENKYLQSIVLPDTLKSIGGYAFYGCDNLNKVEFKSFVAPALENSYNPNAKLSPQDPGYNLLHQHFDIFEFESCYFNFIDLVGKNMPIKMVLPANEDIIGYDSIIYEAYFGTVERAKRSSYVAMHKDMIDFIDLAGKVGKIKEVSLSDEILINDAITVLNRVKQDATDYGYTKEEWDGLVKTVKDAKHSLWALKLSNASKAVQDLQKEIDALPTVFDIDKLSVLQAVDEKISALKQEDKLLLDLTKYNELSKSFDAYVQSLYEEVAPVVNAANGLTLNAVIGIGTGISLVAAAAFVLRKRIGL